MNRTESGVEIRIAQLEEQNALLQRLNQQAWAEMEKLKNIAMDAARSDRERAVFSELLVKLLKFDDGLRDEVGRAIAKHGDRLKDMIREAGQCNYCHRTLHERMRHAMSL